MSKIHFNLYHRPKYHKTGPRDLSPFESPILPLKSSLPSDVMRSDSTGPHFGGTRAWGGDQWSWRCEQRFYQAKWSSKTWEFGWHLDYRSSAGKYCILRVLKTEFGGHIRVGKLFTCCIDTKSFYCVWDNRDDERSMVGGRINIFDVVCFLKSRAYLFHLHESPKTGLCDPSINLFFGTGIIFEAFTDKRLDWPCWVVPHRLGGCVRRKGTDWPRIFTEDGRNCAPIRVTDQQILQLVFSPIRGFNNYTDHQNWMVPTATKGSIRISVPSQRHNEKDTVHRTKHAIWPVYVRPLGRYCPSMDSKNDIWMLTMHYGFPITLETTTTKPLRFTMI